MEWLNLAARLACTEAEGPGRRAAIWVQGCNKRCRGCCNPAYLPLVERDFVSASSVLDWLIRAHDEHDLEGLTILGGEPMLQAQGLAVVARGAQAIGLSVMIFTGYTIDELDALQLPATDQLVSYTDILIDGPYDASEPDTARHWTGSRNQKFHYLTDRYSQKDEGVNEITRTIEVRLISDKTILINGWPR